MKPTPTTATPAIKYIDGQPFVRVIDLGHQWHTNTSNILAIGKRHHVPEEQLRRIDGRVWCSFQGLRYRVAATKHGSSIAGRIREFLDAQEEKKPTAAKPTTEPTPATGLGTAALAAACNVSASQALAKSQDAVELASDARDVAYDARDVAYDVKTDAENNAKSLDAFDDRIAAAENDSYRRFNTAMRRIHNVERRQGDAAVNMTRLEQQQRRTFAAFAVMATVQVLTAIIRLARR